MRIYISGLYSGSNPSPGLGIARSIRQAFPNATLIGVDYSTRSSGLHWPDFDDLWIQNTWNQLHLSKYQQQIKNILDSGSLWISGLDLETIWLSNVLGSHPRLLVPPPTALNKVAKPNIQAAELLPLKIPPHIHTTKPDWELYEFCRKYNWRIWLKGPYYEARRVRSWSELKQAGFELSQTWSTSETFLQAHISGYEETIAFCAYQGRLLDCVWMSKQDITHEGKTWGGRVSEVPEDILSSLRKVIEDINWTGGGELEMVRDSSGILWIIDWNPRFPAWIHGATITRSNLPARLVEEVTGISATQKVPTSNSEFVRVVLEVPTRPYFPLPSLPEPSPHSLGFFLKHPSGMPFLARKLTKKAEVANNKCFEEESSPKVPITILSDLSNYQLNSMPTPCRLFLTTTAQHTFTRARDIVDKVSDARTQVTIAYSIKTNPDSRIIELAKIHGFFVEAISQLEIRKALSIGISPNQIILNGPGKWWPSVETPSPLKAIFCDSLEELDELLRKIRNGMRPAEIIGVRIQPPQFKSRFGIKISDHKRFSRLVILLKSLPPEFLLGVQFHIASSTIGIGNWWSLYESMLHWSKAIEVASGKNIQCLDVGGGWFPDDWDSEVYVKLKDAISKATHFLPKLCRFILEPGKALSQSCMALATKIIEVRQFEGQIEEVVCDGSIAELPESPFWPHRVLFLNLVGHEWQQLRRGNQRVIGRLCMENDILAEDIHIPHHAQTGDILVFCDAGAYDRSMSYEFGKG